MELKLGDVVEIGNMVRHQTTMAEPYAGQLGVLTHDLGPASLLVGVTLFSTGEELTFYRARLRKVLPDEGR